MCMFKYCPSCASEKINFEDERLFRCPDCGFVYYHNTAAATGCIISTGELIALLVRAKEPALGKLDLPGGFVDPGEGALEGLCRECREEIGWEPDISKVSLLASFPNKYLYKGISYNTCDLFFSVHVPGLSEKDFTLDLAESSAVRFVKPSEIKLEDLAFDSTRRAVEAYLACLKG